jgi:hypothetical protein
MTCTNSWRKFNISASIISTTLIPETLWDSIYQITGEGWANKQNDENSCSKFAVAVAKPMAVLTSATEYVRICEDQNPNIPFRIGCFVTHKGIDLSNGKSLVYFLSWKPLYHAIPVLLLPYLYSM